MTTGALGFQGRRLREARLARGLFKTALADMIGVSVTAITNYEENEDAPQEFRVRELAERLNFPFGFFFRPPFDEDISLVHWRKRDVETKSAREMTEQRMRWICDIYSFLSEYVDFPRPALPDIDVPADFRLISGTDIELAAQTARDCWGLDDHPIQDTILALENAGIPVSSLTISSDKQDGFSFYSEKLGVPFVGLNLLDASSARARFDAAHELGHALLHRNVTSEQATNKQYHKVIEDQAHRFAGAFLFPKDRFLSEVRILSLDYLVQHKRRWGMSISAMIVRAGNLGLVDRQEMASLFRNLTRRGWRGPLREPYDDPKDSPLERPRMLRRGFEALVKERLFDGAALLRELCLPKSEVELISSLDPSFLLSASNRVRVSVRDLSATDLESGNVIKFPGR